LMGLTVIITATAVSFLRAPKTSGVHPALVPVNVSNNKEKPEFKSPYEQNQVRNTILKNNKTIQECYLKHLDQKEAKTSGKVQVDWQIAPNGEVLTPQVVTSTMNSKNLEDCVLSKVKTFSFPPPPSDKPVYTTFTYLFRKEGESQAPVMVPFKS
ncbi:MAG: AgmX/PglI C-terminal domain-containing protein, partial [Deltaproteobacteria bacterium]